MNQDPPGHDHSHEQGYAYPFDHDRARPADPKPGRRRPARHKPGRLPGRAPGGRAPGDHGATSAGRWRPAGVMGWSLALVLATLGGFMAGPYGATAGLVVGAVAGFLVGEAVMAVTSRKQEEQTTAEGVAGGLPQGTGPFAAPSPPSPASRNSAPVPAGWDSMPTPAGWQNTSPPADERPPTAGPVGGEERATAARPAAEVAVPAGKKHIPAGAARSCPSPPVMYQPSRLAELPWRLPHQPAPPGMAADSARVGDLEVRAASVVGPGHRIDETHAGPRQDFYRVGRDASARHLVVAVADGMSDSSHSDTAAAVATLSLVNSLRRQLDEGVPLSRLDHRTAFLEAAQQVHAIARQRQWSADSVRTVAVAAVVPTGAAPTGDRDIWIAGLGDTSAWVREPHRWAQLMGEKEQGPDAGRLRTFLPHTPEAVERRLVPLGRGQALVLTTDGVGDALVELPQAHDWFHCHWATPVTALDLLLHISYDSHQRNDDRTAVVVWTPPADGGRR
ncbi:protein phosphatase 2C domain-containing protein [Streptomyces sp. NBC_01235]|uniref:protein phosphatase 2C domain-containing protein n=1 Tax=Streptomyces sp. NBC_01235 TaxID=2903788 RepID=UPI002E12115B|nr:protein phosphatase 2C domain-containing protein [Streptomyces sp. NBC_01235]